MRRIILSVLTMTLLTTFFSSAKAQYNLVPNPSFEIFDTCPNNFDQLRYAIPWSKPSNASPDFNNSCSINPNVDVPSNWAGNEFARTGNGYALIITADYNNVFLQFNNYREYLEVQLTDTLVSNLNYCIRFYVSAGDSMLYVTNNIGVYFSQTYVYDSTFFNLPYLPQFENPSNNNLNSRNGWTLISGSYNALGGEKYIIIGNFRDTTTTVSTYTGWAANPGYIYASYYIDDVLISPCDSLTGINEPQSNQFLKVYPNPFQDYFTIRSKSESIKEMSVQDVLGKIIYGANYINKLEAEINLSNQPSGIYFLKIITNKSNFNYKLIKN